MAVHPVGNGRDVRARAAMTESPAIGPGSESRPSLPGIRRVEHIMGTAIGIDVRDPWVGPEAVEAAFAHLRDVDARFSTYRDDSEISRLARGELALTDCSPDVRLVLGLCDDLRRTSGGYFDIGRHRRDAAVDPSGLVKGWAVEEAAAILGAAGGRAFAINAGGDVVARGSPDGERPWLVGIRHPRLPDRLAAVLGLSDLSIATSGGYERGEHIVDPHTGRPATALLSITVVGPSLTDADAFATAAFAMGEAGVGWVAGRPGYGAFGITPDERVVWTEVVEPLLVRG